jgi:rhodanese-related sulfurtransferase
MKNRLLQITLGLFAFAVVSCAQSDPEDEMSIEEFTKLQKSDSSLVVLDVRTPPELKGPLGKIEGVINIPVQNLKARINELDEYKDKKIAIICRTGNRSGVAQKILENRGFDAVNILGGMKEYREKGH